MTFPGRFVVASFQQAETMLEGFLQVVPFCEEHENVWSPQLVTILIEACSQLDSLWITELRGEGEETRPNIQDYFTKLGSKVSNNWLVIWGEKGVKVQPFAAWHGASTYKPLPWWQAYNNLKHDRLKHRKEATYRNAVDSMAGLFIAMYKCRNCADALAEQEWAVAPARYGMEAADFYGDSCPMLGVVAESKFFSYPMHAETKLEKSTGVVSSKQSHRFQRWCVENRMYIH